MACNLDILFFMQLLLVMTTYAQACDLFLLMAVQHQSVAVVYVIAASSLQTDSGY
jgi:hypothetical protein